ncbi:MFS transporter [Amycolatopsis sp. cmx-4-68]|uniref:MFS transporter n=1 Tax=Amycolatopsis sp. cmx-4-68 TaxID=2790938 RepID=UPI003979D244
MTSVAGSAADERARERGKRALAVVLTASGVSGIGTGVTTVALPLLAASMSQSALEVSLVTFAGRLPWLGLAIFSGAIVDRVDRRAVMIRTDLVRCAVQLGLFALLFWDAASLPLLVLCAFLLGCGDTFFDTASQAVLPTLVSESRPELERANSRMQSVRQTCRNFAGPAVGGFLFALGRWVPVLLDGLSFLVSSTILRRLPSIGRPRTGEAERITAGRIVRDVGEGMAWLRRNPRLLVLFAVSGMSNVVFGADMAIFVLFVTRLLGMSDWQFGLLNAGAVVGGIVGSVVFSRLRKRFSLRAVLFSALVVRAVAFAAVGVMSSALAIWFLMTIVGIASVIWNIVSVSTRQAAIPQELRGRVMSCFRCIIVGALAVGAVAGGALADAIGLRWPYLLGGALMLVVVAVSRRSLSKLLAEDEVH